MGSSAPVFQRHLAEAGLGRDPGPVSQAYLELYRRLGESALLMQAARFGPRMARGWPHSAVTEAAEAAATELFDLVPIRARMQLDYHRARSEPIVLATTSPRSWVTPLAQRLGFDHIVATEWEQRDGVFTGNLASPFLWGRAKAAAIAELAAVQGFDLRRSSAYSDSYFDIPMLLGVGRPVAVNPDARLAAVAALHGWPIKHFDVPDGIIKIAGAELQELLAPLGRPALFPTVEFEISGIENIPRQGGAIIVANHRSYFDPIVLGLLVAMSGRRTRFLGKREVFDAPIIGTLAAAIGGIPVDRGTGSDAPLQAAADALRCGDLVAIMPQGTIPRGPAFFAPQLTGRWGAARLAALADVPVIPIGLWGTEKVWPRSARFPRMDLRHRPTVTVSVGAPLTLVHRSPNADTKRIMAAIMDQLPPEAKISRTPTEAELALTYPPGYAGDPSQEAHRRPGTDT